MNLKIINSSSQIMIQKYQCNFNNEIMKFVHALVGNPRKYKEAGGGLNIELHNIRSINNH